jgi:hypothetical protein
MDQLSTDIIRRMSPARHCAAAQGRGGAELDTRRWSPRRAFSFRKPGYSSTIGYEYDGLVWIILGYPDSQPIQNPAGISFEPDI